MGPFTYRHLIPPEHVFEGNWHGHFYFHAFNEARIAYSESRGNIQRSALRDAGLRLTVLENYCRYFFRFGLGDIALVEVSVLEVKRKIIKFGYKVFKEGDGEHKLYAEGWITVVLVDYKTGKAVEIPEWFGKHLKTEN